MINYKNFSILAILIISFIFTGCSHVSEFAKKVWGSSTQTLNNERKNAVVKAFRCDYDQCVAKILELTNIPKDTKPSERVKYFDLFMQDPHKKIMIVMGVPGAVDTTEVGIFFVPTAKNTTRLEFSSLSTAAKIKVSDMVAAKLSPTFPEVKP